MRKILTFFLLFFTLITSAHANTYIGEGLGWKFQRFSHIRHKVPNQSLTYTPIRQSDRGEVVHLFAGYDWDTLHHIPVRTELDLSFRHGRYRHFNQGIIVATQTPLLQSGAPEAIEVTSRAFIAMLRILYDLAIDDTFTLYSGLGLGATLDRVSAEKYSFPVQSNSAVLAGFNSRHNIAFAWALVSGVKSPITPSTHVAMEYQFLHAGSAETSKGCSASSPTCIPGEYSRAVNTSHNVIFRLVHFFGVK